MTEMCVTQRVIPLCLSPKMLSHLKVASLTGIRVFDSRGDTERRLKNSKDDSKRGEIAPLLRRFITGLFLMRNHLRVLYRAGWSEETQERLSSLLQNRLMLFLPCKKLTAPRFFTETQNEALTQGAMQEPAPVIIIL